MKTPDRHGLPVIAMLACVCVMRVGGVESAPSPQAKAGAEPYHRGAEIRIGSDGGWDYASVDPAAHRLYVTHGTQVVVIDTVANKVVGTIADTPGVHGFAIAHDLGVGFASNGRGANVSIVDLHTLDTLSKVPTGENPDAILFEPGKGEVYAFNGRGKSATVFGAKSGEVVATIPLNGKPEFAQADPDAGRVFVNLEDKDAIAVIDTTSHAVTATWPIAPGEEASGMAIDLANHRLFIGCSNKLMLMIDSTTGKVVGSVPIGPGVDANAFDPETKLAFASSGGGDGTITVAHEDSPTKLTVVQTIKTQPGTRTMTIDPATHRLYAAAADFEPAPAPTADTPRPRPKQIAGSFKVLVYEMK